MVKQVVNFIETTVSHKVPEFLYHMTTKRNYRAIMKDGLLRMHNDGRFGQGVFTLDLKNYFEKWKDLVDEQTGENYVELLLKQVSKGRNKIVMLRIPTSKLNMDKLAVRSQNRLHNYCYTDFVHNEAEPEAKILANLYQRGELSDERELRRKFSQEISKEQNIPNVEHCFQGVSAKEAYKYEQEAIEYIYRDNIPVSDIEKIGEVNQMWCMLSRKYDDNKPVKSIFDFMLKRSPEVQSTKLLNF